MAHKPDMLKKRLPASDSLPTRRGWICLAVIAALGILGNIFNLSLFYGIDFIFGSVAVVITIYYFGMFWGIIVCAASAVYTIFLWGHPYGMILFLLESVFIGYFFCKQKQTNLINLDIKFWLFIGAPLSFLLYHYALSLPTSVAVLIMCKQGLNGLCNTTIAVGITLLLSGSRLKKITGRGSIRSNPWLIKDLTTFLFAGIILLPMFTSLAVWSRNQTAKLLAQVNEYADIESSRAVLTTNIFLDEHINILKEYLNLYETDSTFKPVHSRFESVVAVFKDQSHPPVSLVCVPGCDILKDQHLKEPVPREEVRIGWTDSLEGLKTNSCLTIYLTGNNHINLFAILSSEVTDQFQSKLSHNGWKFNLMNEPRHTQTGFGQYERYKNLFIQEKGEIHYLAVPKDKTLPEVELLQQSEWHEFRHIPNSDNVYIHVKIIMKQYLHRLQNLFGQIFVYGLCSVLLVLLIIPFMNRILAKPLLELAAFTKQYTSKGEGVDRIFLPQSSVTEIKHLSDGLSRMIENIEYEKEKNKTLLTNVEQSEKQIKDILEILDDGIITADENGIILSYNNGAEQIFGYSGNEIVGQTINMLLPIRYRESHLSKIGSFISGEIDSKQMGNNRMVYALTKNKDEITVEITIAKLDSSMGILLIAILRDVTDRITITERVERQASLITTVATDRNLFSQSPQRIIEFILTSAADIFGLKRIGLWMFDSTLSRLTSYYLLDLKIPETSNFLELSLEDHPLYFEKIFQGNPFCLDDALSDPIMQSFKRDYLLPLNIFSMLDIPLYIAGNLVGVVCVEETGKKRTWSSDEISFGNSLASMIALVLEIAKHKSTEFKLEQVLDDLVRFIDTANAPIFGIDGQGLVNEWNQTAERITGYQKDEVMGRNLVEDFITDEYKAAVKEVLDKALNGEETANYEFPLYTKDGDRVDVLLNSTIRRDVNGVIVGVVGVGQDITELSEYRDNLEGLIEERTFDLNTSLSNTQQARDWIDGILRSVADGLIVTDTENRILLMNKAAETLLNIRFEEVFERTIESVITEKDLQNKIKKIFDKKTSGHQFDFEIVSNQDDDMFKNKIMRATTAIIFHKDGKEAGIVILIHDVTHEREVDQMKTEFISTAAHELRTPLTSIQGFSEILITRKDLPPESRDKYLGFINKQALNRKYSASWVKVHFCSKVLNFL